MKLILTADSVRFPLTGIGRYTHELALEIAKKPMVEQLLYLTGRRVIETLPSVTETGPALHKVKQMAQKSQIISDLYRYVMPLRRAWAMRPYQDHLLHGTNFYLPAFSGPSVCTFHDLSSFKWTQFITRERIRYQQKESLKALERADFLITVSEFVRHDLSEYFSWPLDKIRAIPLAAGQAFKPRQPAELVRLKEYDLTPNGYCLYVGTIEPRKNLENLLRAYQALPLPERQSIPLILSGYAGWSNEKIMKLLDQGKREGWVRYLGFVPSADLPLLFSGCRLFVFPSIYEGFGLPVLEAMASGVPVMTSDRSSLPEVAGNVGLLCDPDDVLDMTQKLLKGLSDEEWRSQVKCQGVERAARFSWRRCADETIQVYQQVLKIHGH